MTDERTSRITLGERLKEEREYRGFSRDEVARYLGVTPSALSLIESGSRDVSTEELGRLARLFQIRMESLAGDHHDASETESFPLVARAAAELSPPDRDEILRFARYLRTMKSNDHT